MMYTEDPDITSLKLEEYLDFSRGVRWREVKQNRINKMIRFYNEWQTEYNFDSNRGFEIISFIERYQNKCELPEYDYILTRMLDFIHKRMRDIRWVNRETKYYDNETEDTIS